MNSEKKKEKNVFESFLRLVLSAILIGQLVHIHLQTFHIDFNLNSVFDNFKLQPMKQKTLVLYVYSDSPSHFTQRLQFFLNIGVGETDDVDYIFIINGFKVNAQIPPYYNIKVIQRPNTCFHFGSYGEVIKSLGGLNALKQYKAIIFLNPSAVGPLLPKYWPESIHWTEIFTSRLIDDVHAVGSSLSCTKNKKIEGPRVEGHAFGATIKAIELAFSHGIFECRSTIQETLEKGEYAFSSLLLNNSMNLDTLLLNYEEKIDWRDRKNWDCNENRDPLRKNHYGKYNMTVHPLEVVFHIPDLSNEDIFGTETKLYMKWAIQRAKNNMFVV